MPQDVIHICKARLKNYKLIQHENTYHLLNQWRELYAWMSILIRKIIAKLEK